MDASAFTVKSVPDIAAGQLFYMAGGWWIKAVTTGGAPVHGAMCVVGPRQGQWDTNAEEKVITISDGWQWFADVTAPITPTNGMAPAGSLAMLVGKRYVVGVQCVVLLEEWTTHITASINALHFSKWTAMIRKSDGGTDADELFQVVSAGS